ncbi:MAG: M48 family metallopeptidase [Candidatus Pacearchaeota archaeon]
MKKSFKPLRVISRIGNRRITYFVIKRNVKYPRLEFKHNSLYLIIPREMKDFKSIVKRKKKWILKKQELIDKFFERNEYLIDKFIIFGVPNELEFFHTNFLNEAKNLRKIKDALKQILFQKVKTIAEEYSKEFGINYNKIFIRTQTTKWASCSSKKNLSFNMKMLSLPEPLINYLVFHEILHLIEKNHNEKFISLIKKEFPNYEKMEEELTKYWFILNNNYWWNKLS